MNTAGSIVALLMVLALALYALRSHGLSLERKAQYIVVWIIIFVVVAFAMSRIMA